MADSMTRDPSSRLRTVLAANAGAVLEWFDLVLYALFAAVLGRVFFPSADPNVSLLLSFGAFAISWLVRPLGAVVIGPMRTGSVASRG